MQSSAGRGDHETPRYNQREWLSAGPGCCVTLVFVCLSAGVSRPALRPRPWLPDTRRDRCPVGPRDQGLPHGCVRKHNENTDLTRWKGAIYFVPIPHRGEPGAGTQQLAAGLSLEGPGRDSQLQADHPALPTATSGTGLLHSGDPALHQSHHAAPRLLVARHGVDSISVAAPHSTDRQTWLPIRAIGPVGAGFGGS